MDVEAPSGSVHGRTIIHLSIITGGVAALQVFLHFFVGMRPSMLNVEWWKALARVMAKHGFLNVWTPYPPVFPALFYGLYRAVPESAILPIWQTFNGCTVLGQAALIFALVRMVSGRFGQRSLHAALLASFAFVVVMIQPNSLVLLGPWMDQFDYLPAFLLLLGLLLLVQERTTASAVVCGIGIMTKIFPWVLVPAAFVGLGWQRGLRYAAVAAAVCIVVAAPFLIGNSDIFLSTYRWSADRIPWESVWAYAWPGRGSRELLANLPEARSPQLIEQRFTIPYDPEKAVTPESRELRARRTLANTMTATLAIAATLAATILLARRKTRSPGDICRVTLALLLIFLIFSKGFSSYFIVWAAPLICIVHPGAGGYALCAALVLLSNTELMGLRARFEQILGNAENVRHFTRLGSPHTLFWRSIFYREMLLIIIAGRQIVRLIKSREARE